MSAQFQFVIRSLKQVFIGEGYRLHATGIDDDEGRVVGSGPPVRGNVRNIRIVVPADIQGSRRKVIEDQPLAKELTLTGIVKRKVGSAGVILAHEAIVSIDVRKPFQIAGFIIICSFGSSIVRVHRKCIQLLEAGRNHEHR